MFFSFYLFALKTTTLLIKNGLQKYSFFLYSASVFYLFFSSDSL